MAGNTREAGGVLARATWVAGVAILVCLATPAVAWAEWFADLYLGAAVTESADLEITAPAVAPGVTIVFQDVEFDTSLEYGGRVGHWFEAVPVLGLGLDLSHFEPDIGRQDVTATVIGADTLARIDASITILSVDVMLRWGFLATPELPRGRLQPYVTVGPAVVFSRIRDTTTLDPPRQSDSDTSVGVKVGTGLAWQLHRAVAVFGEYRFTRFSARFRVSDHGASETIDADVSTHHVVGGVSFRF